MGLVAALALPASQVSAAPYCGITWGSGAKSNMTMSGKSLLNIRTGQHTCYDRMVFDLSGTAKGYSVEYVSEVRTDAKGDIIHFTKSGAKLQIVVRAAAYDASYNPTYPGIVDAALPGVNLAGYQTFKEAKFAGSFEGQTTVGLVVRARLPFRVFTTDNHVVVDVAHYW